MKFICGKILRFLILLLILCFATFTASAEDFTYLPFAECWHYPTENLSKFTIASDNDLQLYLPLLNGTLQSLNSVDGTPLWRTELGGEISSEVLASKKFLFLATKASANSLHTITVRSLSSTTGVTNWTASVSADDSGEVYLQTSGQFIVLVTQSGRIFGFDRNSGRIIFNSELGESLSSAPKFSGVDKLFITARQHIFIYSISQKKFIGSVSESAGGQVLFGDDEAYLVGDESGRMSLFDFTSRKKLWEVRLGAGAGEILEIPGRFIVSSNDNYIYLFGRKNGNRLWKRRLSGRQRGSVFENTETGVFSTLSGDTAVFIESRSGKIVNRILLKADNYFINKPLLFEKTLFAPTNTGVYAYSSVGCKTIDAQR